MSEGVSATVAIWNVNILDTTPPVVATISATAPTDGFLPSMAYTGSAVAWSPGQTVPTVKVGAGQVTLQISANDPYEDASLSVSVTCSPSCGTIAASGNSQAGFLASVPITDPLTQLSIQAADSSGNLATTYLNVQLNLDLGGDGIYNNVDGNCTTTPPTSNVFNSSVRFGDCQCNRASYRTNDHPVRRRRCRQGTELPRNDIRGDSISTHRSPARYHYRSL